MHVHATCKIRIGLGQKKNSGSVLACPRAIQIGPPKKGDDHCVRDRHVHIGSYLLSIYLHLKNSYSYRLRCPAPQQKKHSKKTNIPISKPKKSNTAKKHFQKNIYKAKKIKLFHIPVSKKIRQKRVCEKKYSRKKLFQKQNFPHRKSYLYN